MNPPQKVTLRYVRNLLVKGSNNDFVLRSIFINYSMIDEIQVGYYYTAVIQMPHGLHKEAVGVTPEQAIQRCLLKHGVTFR
jgi:hypothetical protein